MRTVKTILLASVLATLSFTSGVEESLAGVATPAAVTPALAGSHDGAIDQVQWRRGWGWRGGWGGRRWGGGWGWRRGWGWRGYGWGPAYGYGWGGYGGCWRWGPWGRVWVC
jgi:hypothetical protein